MFRLIPPHERKHKRIPMNEIFYFRTYLSFWNIMRRSNSENREQGMHWRIGRHLDGASSVSPHINSKCIERFGH